jgi:hypothetical protein
LRRVSSLSRRGRGQCYIPYSSSRVSTMTYCKLPVV